MVLEEDHYMEFRFQSEQDWETLENFEQYDVKYFKRIKFGVIVKDGCSGGGEKWSDKVYISVEQSVLLMCWYEI